MSLLHPRKKITEVPRKFIYEEIDGVPLYYRGYKEAIAHNLSVEDIMGSGELQSTLISVILDFLYNNLDKKSYRIITSEAGLH